MKRFEQHQLREAYAHAEAGGQALHICNTRSLGIHQKADVPRCFRESEQFAHLFDQDRERLVRTARWLGVKSVYVDRPGTLGQHIDLCGFPLRKAIEKARHQTKQDKQAELFADVTAPAVQQEVPV